MDELNNLTFESLLRYFAVLESVGYMNDVNTNKLLLLLFLLEFLEDYQEYITEEDYLTINTILQCLAQTSCLIPFMEYKQLSYPNKNYLNNLPLRVTEDNDGNMLRVTELGYYRLANL